MDLTFGLAIWNRLAIFTVQTNFNHAPYPDVGKYKFSMYKLLLTFCFTLLFSIGNCQSLKQKLWDFSSACHKAIRQGYEDSYDKEPESLKDYCNTCIDDSGNGYLFIEGSWPTCGCSCHSEIGAFRTSQGNYSLIKYESWPCSNRFGVYSTENIVDIMPENLGLQSFNLQTQNDSINYFHLEMEIPRIGTNTKVKLRLFPIGQVGIGTTGISYNTESSKIIYPQLYSLDDIIEALGNEQHLNTLMTRELNELPEIVKEKLLSELGESSAFKTVEELMIKLRFIRNIYNKYISLQYDEMILSWNRGEGRFYVKEKLGSPSKMSFYEFIKNANYFSYAC
jgi:predicted house-cleaning noncanonical NTP pyrophosphatase (MazG superfamily)